MIARSGIKPHLLQVQTVLGNEGIRNLLEHSSPLHLPRRCVGVACNDEGVRTHARTHTTKTALGSKQHTHTHALMNIRET